MVHFPHSYITLFPTSLQKLSAILSLLQNFHPLGSSWRLLNSYLISQLQCNKKVTSWWLFCSPTFLTPFQFTGAKWLMPANGKCHIKVEAFKSWCLIPQLFLPLPQPPERPCAPRSTCWQSLCQSVALGSYVGQSSQQTHVGHVAGQERTLGVLRLPKCWG